MLVWPSILVKGTRHLSGKYTPFKQETQLFKPRGGEKNEYISPKGGVFLLHMPQGKIQNVTIWVYITHANPNIVSFLLQQEYAEHVNIL